VQSDFSLCIAIFARAKELSRVQRKNTLVQNDFSLCRVIFPCAAKKNVCAKRFFCVQRDFTDFQTNPNSNPHFLQLFPALRVQISITSELLKQKGFNGGVHRARNRRRQV
jgi:hypothetical protein